MTTTATAPTEEQQPDPSTRNAAVEWLKGQYALFILIVLLIIAALSSPAFLTGTNITNLLLQMSIIGVVVMAELIIVLTGGIDISVGSALGLAAVLFAGLFGGFSVWLALLVGMAVGGIIGLVNGWLVSFRGLEPFIVTLGMLALARGLVYAYSEGIPITPEASDTFAQIGQTTVLGIPVLTLIWIAMVLIVAFLLRFALPYVPVGTHVGNLMELEAIAAVVIGGAALSGGRGTVFGAVVGTIIFQVIANLLSLLNVSTFLQDAFRGALILVAVTLATVQFARKRSRSAQPATK